MAQHAGMIADKVLTLASRVYWKMATGAADLW